MKLVLTVFIGVLACPLAVAEDCDAYNTVTRMSQPKPNGDVAETGLITVTGSILAGPKTRIKIVGRHLCYDTKFVDIGLPGIRKVERYDLRENLIYYSIQVMKPGSDDKHLSSYAVYEPDGELIYSVYFAGDSPRYVRADGAEFDSVCDLFSERRIIKYTVEDLRVERACERD